MIGFAEQNLYTRASYLVGERNPRNHAFSIQLGDSMPPQPGLKSACRRQLFDLSDDMATKVDIQFYLDARDALLKAIGD